MITQEQFEEFLALEHELSGVEFKGPGPRGDEYLRAKVARAVMGMTNRRDGGIVIIGVEDRSSRLNPIGLSTNEVASWRNYDHVGNALANYMSPPPTFNLSILEHHGKAFAVLEVDEFTDVPTICKKEYHREHQSGHREVVLRVGVCYIRSRHKAETVEVSSLEHMRELLDLAIEKGVRRFVTQAQRADMVLSGSSQIGNENIFEQQIDNWTNPMVEKIQTRGFWKTIIRPDNFTQERIDYNALYPLVQNSSVDLRGDAFPNVVLDLPIIRGADCVGQQIEVGHFLEVWNIYQSGQFIYFSGMVDDWLDQLDSTQLRQSWQLGHKLAIGEVIRFEKVSTESYSPQVRIARSDWVDRILPNLGYRHSVIIELPLIRNPRVSEVYLQAVEALDQARQAFAQEDYRGAIRHTRDVLEYFATSSQGGQITAFCNEHLAPLIGETKSKSIDRSLNAMREIINAGSHFDPQKPFTTDRALAAYVIETLALYLRFISSAFE